MDCNSDDDLTDVIPVCPLESELTAVSGPFTCPTCSTVFPNIASCELHQIKTHKKKSLFLNKKGKNYVFFCPIKLCKYNIKMKYPRYFMKMKFLKQHYLRSHARKDFSCPDCGKSYASKSTLLRHTSSECGIKFECKDCGSSYSSREALLTHCRRNSHSYECASKHTKRKIVPRPGGFFRRILEKPVVTPAPPSMETIAAAALSELSRAPVVVAPTTRSSNDVSTQTPTFDQPDRSHITAGTQTDIDRIFQSSIPDNLTDIVIRECLTSATQTNQDMFFDLGMFQDIDQHVHNQTQTEVLPPYLMMDEDIPVLSNTHTQTADIDEYSHNCTQTCDDILLNDFVELSDIETQTAWASLNVDSFLVTAQTQTLL